MKEEDGRRWKEMESGCWCGVNFVLSSERDGE